MTSQEHDLGGHEPQAAEKARRLAAARDEADIALCRASAEDPAGAMTHDEFMAALAAEDATA
jgi:hypothetical protein